MSPFFQKSRAAKNSQEDTPDHCKSVFTWQLGISVFPIIWIEGNLLQVLFKMLPWRSLVYYTLSICRHYQCYTLRFAAIAGKFHSPLICPHLHLLEVPEVNFWAVVLGRRSILVFGLCLFKSLDNIYGQKFIQYIIVATLLDLITV